MVSHLLRKMIIHCTLFHQNLSAAHQKQKHGFVCMPQHLKFYKERSWSLHYISEHYTEVPSFLFVVQFDSHLSSLLRTHSITLNWRVYLNYSPQSYASHSCSLHISCRFFSSAFFCSSKNMINVNDFEETAYSIKKKVGKLRA